MGSVPYPHRICQHGVLPSLDQHDRCAATKSAWNYFEQSKLHGKVVESIH
jgi:hypothetical protein